MRIFSFAVKNKLGWVSSIVLAFHLVTPSLQAMDIDQDLPHRKRKQENDGDNSSKRQRIQNEDSDSFSSSSSSSTLSSEDISQVQRNSQAHQLVEDEEVKKHAENIWCIENSRQLDKNYKSFKGFCSLANIEERCLVDDTYALVALLSVPDEAEMSAKFPRLYETIKKRANEGIAAAQCNLGYMYMSGRIGKIPPHSRFHTLIFGEIVGNETWCINSADTFGATYKVENENWNMRNESSHAEAPNYEAALSWFEKAADQGYTLAQYLPTLCRYSTPDYNEKANKWLLKAVAKNYFPAQLLLARKFMRLGQDTEHFPIQDVKIRVYCIKKAAEQGDGEAQSWYGLKLIRFQGGTSDTKKQGMELLTKAALQGNFEAKRHLGFLYLEGTQCEQDYGRSFYWLLKSVLPTRTGFPVLREIKQLITLDYIDRRPGSGSSSSQLGDNERIELELAPLLSLENKEEENLPSYGLHYLQTKYDLKTLEHDPVMLSANSILGEKCDSLAKKIALLIDATEKFFLKPDPSREGVQIPSVEAGFMVPIGTLSKELNDCLISAEKKPPFLALHIIGLQRYLTIEEKNVQIANVVGNSAQQIKLELQELAAWYRLAHVQIDPVDIELKRYYVAQIKEIEEKDLAVAREAIVRMENVVALTAPRHLQMFLEKYPAWKPN